MKEQKRKKSEMRRLEKWVLDVLDKHSSDISLGREGYRAKELNNGRWGRNGASRVCQRCLFCLSNRGEVCDCCSECGVNKGNAIDGRWRGRQKEGSNCVAGQEIFLRNFYFFSITTRYIVFPGWKSPKSLGANFLHNISMRLELNIQLAYLAT